MVNLRNIKAKVQGRKGFVGQDIEALIDEIIEKERMLQGNISKSEEAKIRMDLQDKGLLLADMLGEMGLRDEAGAVADRYRNISGNGGSSGGRGGFGGVMDRLF